MPLPRDYVLGIDYLKFEVEAKKWSFLMGEWKFGSWPYYYIMTTLFKTPEPTLLAAMIGFGVLVVGIKRKMVRSENHYDVYVSGYSHFNQKSESYFGTTS